MKRRLWSSAYHGCKEKWEKSTENRGSKNGCKLAQVCSGNCLGLIDDCNIRLIIGINPASVLVWKESEGQPVLSFSISIYRNVWIISPALLCNLYNEAGVGCNGIWDAKMLYPSLQSFISAYYTRIIEMVNSWNAKEFLGHRVLGLE